MATATTAVASAAIVEAAASEAVPLPSAHLTHDLTEGTKLYASPKKDGGSHVSDSPHPSLVAPADVKLETGLVGQVAVPGTGPPVNERRRQSIQYLDRELEEQGEITEGVHSGSARDLTMAWDNRVETLKIRKHLRGAELIFTNSKGHMLVRDQHLDVACRYLYPVAYIITLAVFYS